MKAKNELEGKGASEWNDPRFGEMTSLGEKADALFDVVGVARIPGDTSLLVLGLESTPDRNLDDFGHTEGGFRLYGFEEYAEPLLEELMDFIRYHGYTAQLGGRWTSPSVA